MDSYNSCALRALPSASRIAAGSFWSTWSARLCFFFSPAAAALRANSGAAARAATVTLKIDLRSIAFPPGIGKPGQDSRINPPCGVEKAWGGESVGSAQSEAGHAADRLAAY